jgi:chloramphenicol O-acetyltransferase
MRIRLIETYNRVRLGKHLSEIFNIKNDLKQEDVLSTLLFNFAVQHAVRRAEENQDDFKLNGTHQLLFYADDVNILGGSVHTVGKNMGVLVVAIEENGLEVNTDETKYMIMSRDQNARRSHNIKFDNSLFEIVEEFKYLETTLTNQNSIQEENKNR